jgi:hypothetical protein
LNLVPGLEFRPVSTDTVMRNCVSVRAGRHRADAPRRAADRVILSGERRFSVGDETRVMHAGDCAVIPPDVEPGGVADARRALRPVSHKQSAHVSVPGRATSYVDDTPAALG